MNKAVDEMLQQIAGPNQDVAMGFWQELQDYLPAAAGSTKSHHAWEGGYKDHV